MSRKSIPGTTVVWLGSITRLHSAKTTRYSAEIFKLMLLSAVVWVMPAIATTQFSYTLPGALMTSAGVYQPDGTLVRTLWRNERKPQDKNSGTWDDLDDQGKPAPAGNYEIRVISHNVNYVWEGAVGNTSTYNSGKTVHFGMFPIRDMAFAGSTGFYTTASNEGHYNFRSFNTLAPQQVTDSWTWVVDTRTPLNEVIKLRAYSNDRSWSFATTDGTWVYFAAPKGWNEFQNVSDQPGYVTAMNVADHSQAYFTNGVRLSNGAVPMYPYPNGITAGGQPGLSGIAVQKTGNILAVAVQPDNTIYLFDKRTGAPLSSIYVDSPRRMVFAPNNDLWVTAGTSVICYTNMNTTPTLKSTITGFSHPLAVGVSPNGKTAVVADGGASMQLKAYSTSSLSKLWTYGQLGGNPVNGPNVRNDRFWFTNGELSDGVGGVDWASMKEDTFVTYAPDGTFWVGDGDNGRAIHFNANRMVKEKIATGKGSYVVAVDANNPTRVFDGFHEYKVDYTKPLAGSNGSWTLVKNWRAKLPAQYWAGTNFRKGLLNVATLSNGRTYAQIFNRDVGAWEVGELTTDGVRLTGTVLSDRSTLNSDGSIRRALASQTNGSFEDPDRSPWGLMNNSQQTNIVTAPGAATDGDNYLNVGVVVGSPGRAIAGIFQNIAGINLAEGKSFTLSFDVKDGVNPFTGLASSLISLNSQANGFISEAVSSSLQATPKPDGWTHYQGDFVLPDSQPDFKLLQIRLLFYKDGGGVGTTYEGMIDNIALAQAGGLAIVDRGFPRWWNRSLTGFDALGNPQWGAWSVLASASGGISDPVPHLVSADPPQSPITSSNILVSYDQSLKPGWHLGGIRAGDNKWLWKASPSSILEDFVKPVGNYEIKHQVGNGGNVVTTSDRHVIAGYHGEGYRSFQASQFMHFYDDGLFIGQFGTPNTDIFYNLLPTETVLTGPVEFTRAGYTAGVLAGFAGNAMSPVLTKAPNGITYLYVNDEWGYGPQRWRIDGLDTVQEYKGSGSLGGAITLSF